MKRRISVFCDRDSFLLRAPVLRHGMPRRSLKDCHVAALLAMTQNWNVFILKTDVFHFLRLFFARCCSAPFFKRFVPEIVSFSNVSFRKLLRFSANPTRFVIARRARAPDAAILNGAICHPGMNYGCAGRSRTMKERESKRNEAANSLFCDRDYFLLHAPVLRSGIPYL